MNAPTQSRIITGYIIVAKNEGIGITYYGPFGSEYRASEYAARLGTGFDITIEPMTIPHNLFVYVQSR
jgi:hypothetical protein